MNDFVKDLSGLAPDMEETILLCRLALERCQQNLAHLHAILHFCIPEHSATPENNAVAAIRSIITSMERELSYSVDTLAVNIS